MTRTIKSCLILLLLCLFSTAHTQAQTSCTASFNTSPVNASTLQFTNTSTASGTITSTLWNFGDGDFSAQSSPVHSYVNAGYYLVSLSIQTSLGCTDTQYDTVYVAQGCGSSCQAAFSYSVNHPTVTFNDQSTATSTIASWYWDFGDGSFTYNQNPSHNYAATGTYVICLTITTQDSCVSTYCDSVYVQCGSQPTCQANFSHIDTAGTVFFNDNSTASGAIVGYAWDFGDGNFGSGPNPNHTYASPGTYIACLTIFTIDSCSSTYCDSITVAPNCTCGPADFTFTVSGNTVSFTNTSQGCFSSSGWIFGGGVPASTQTNPTITYPGPGTYNVCLCIYDANGNICDIICKQVVIGNGCNTTAQIGYTNNGQTYNFQGLVTGNPTNFYWWFGDGNSSNQQNPTHTYSQPGNYTVCFTAYDSAWTCYDSTCVTITVGNGCQLQGGFTYNVSGNTVSFSDASTGGTPNFWSWSFGDGNGSGQQNPTHTYAQPGTYLVCLFVEDSSWCMDTVCQYITIQGGCNTTAQIGYTNNGQTYNFQGLVTGNPTNFYWWFGDGNSSNQQNPTHTYSQPGNYTVCFTAYDSAWTCYDSTCVTITVGGGCQLQGGFTYNVSGNTVSFSDASTGGTPNFWSWSFGDGNGSGQQNPTHTYAQPGTYLVCLFVEDSSWCMDTVCQYITIQGGCNTTAQIGYTNNGQTYNFQGLVTGNPTNFYWWFGDGNSSNQQNPTHTYSQPGNYTVCFTAYDSAWTCYDSTCVTITVGGGCNVNASFSYSVNGNTVSFNNSSSGNIGWVEWYFGDGSPVSNAWNPTHTYNQPGTYYACLLAYDTLQGCLDTLCANITISGGCQLTGNFGYSVSGNTVSFTDLSSGNVTNWYWSFGDGNSSYQQNPTHTYAQAGTYWACLSIFDSLSQCFDSLCYQVTVSGGSQCNINANINTQQAGNTVNFSVTHNAAGPFFWWNFGDGNTSYQANPSHSYNNIGTYYACVTVWDSLSQCSDTACVVIEITSNGQISNTGNMNRIVPGSVGTFPNPTRDQSSLQYELSTASDVRVEVFSVTGDRMEVLLNENQEAGEHQVDWNAQPLAAGIYLYKITAGDEQMTKRFIKQ